MLLEVTFFIFTILEWPARILSDLLVVATQATVILMSTKNTILLVSLL